MACSRRIFLSVGIGSLAAPWLCACSERAVTAPPVATDAYMLDGNEVIVSVDRIAALASDDQPAVLLAARIIVVRAATDTFRAFSVECPHSGCAVSNVDGPRLICPCHGSEFSSTGQRLAGPAPRGLESLAATFDTTTRTLRVRRAA